MLPYLKITFFILLTMLPASLPVGAQEDEQQLMTSEEEAEFAELEAFFEGDSGEEAVEKRKPAPSEPPSLSTWLWVGDVSLGTGYDDNVLLSDMPVSSLFVQPEAQLYGTRLSTSRFKASVLGYYQGRYFRHAQIDDEHLAFAKALGEWKSTEWRLRSSLEFLYARQVYDATALRTAEVRESGMITQSRPKWSVSARRDGRGAWYTEGYLAVSRSLFREIDEDYWAFRGELRRGRAWASGLELEVYAGVEREHYVDAFSRNPQGLRLDERPLRIDRLLAGGEVEWEFGKDENWALSLNVWAYSDEEQGGSYYDRWRIDVSPGVSWEPGGWTFAVDGGFQFTDYRSRHASFSEPTAQWQRKWSGRARAGYAWGRNWESELLFQYTELQSNRASIRYVRRAITGVLTYSF